MNDQVTASTMPRAASARLALRVRTCSAVSTGLRGALAALERRRAARGRRRRCARPPRRCRPCPRCRGRHDGIATFTVSPVPATKKPRWSSTRFISASGTSRPESRFTSATGKSMMRSSACAAPATVISDGAPPQKSSTICGRQLQPRHHEVRIDAALEAIARVRIDAELAPGLRDVERRPQRRLDQHVGGRRPSSRSPRRP